MNLSLAVNVKNSGSFHRIDVWDCAGTTLYIRKDRIFPER
nr:MAG TPA: hypothetical protein [Caudoviricetes sp.]